MGPWFLCVADWVGMWYGTRMFQMEWAYLDSRLGAHIRITDEGPLFPGPNPGFGRILLKNS